MHERSTPGRRWTLAAIFIAAAGCAQPNNGNGQGSSNEAQQPKQESNVDEAARAGLATLKSLAEGPDAATLGLTSTDEAANATLGQRYDVFVIGLDRLREYRPGTAVAGLMTASPDAVFPIMVNGQVRSSMTVTRSDGGFVASEIGGAGLMRATARAAERAPGDFLLRVPALGLQFVGRRQGSNVMLTLTTPDPRLKVQPGVAMPADQVLQQLARVAQTYNGEPM